MALVLKLLLAVSIWTCASKGVNPLPDTFLNGRFSFSGVPDDGESVRLGSTHFTFKTSRLGPNDVHIDSSSTVASVSAALASKINTSDVTATAVSDEVSVLVTPDGGSGIIEIESDSDVIDAVGENPSPQGIIIQG